MADKAIRVEVRDGTGTIILNRADRRNALTRSMLDDLQSALDDLYRQRSVRAVIVTGAGSAFCAGMDLNEIDETAQCPDALSQWGQETEAYCNVIRTMLELPKPIIAAVNGPAVAAGAGLVLASDIVVGCTAATFGLPEPRRGIVAGTVAPLLVFRIGGGHAARLLLTSAMIGADQALGLGLYHELTPSDKVWARAVQLADECALGAPAAVQLTKRMLCETIGDHLGAQLTTGAAFSATARTTPAAAEGIRAFLEKRAPDWDR